MSASSDMRSIEGEEIRRPLVPIAEASSHLREYLEQVGLTFQPDDDPGLPGPVDTAAIELTTGTQFAFEHHHAHPANFVVIRAERGTGSPADRVAELIEYAGVDVAAFTRTEGDWDI